MSTTRREALKALIGAPALACIDDVSIVEGEIDAFVIQLRSHMDHEARECMKRDWKYVFKGTRLEGKPLLIMPPHMELKQLRAR